MASGSWLLRLSPAALGSRPRPPRLGQWLYAIRPRASWLSFALLLFVLLSVTGSVESALWAKLPALGWVALGGVSTGLAASYAGGRSWRLHAEAFVLGLGISLWLLTSTLEGGAWGDRVWEVLDRLWLWTTTAFGEGISLDDMPFAFFLLMAAWTVSYISAWLVFRRKSVLGPVVVAGFAMITNLSYLPPKFGEWFFLFLLTSVLLVAHLSAMRRREKWQSEGMMHADSLPYAALHDAFWFGLLVLGVAFLAPLLHYAQPTLRESWNNLRSPLVRFEKDFGRLFATVPAKVPLPFYTFGPNLPFRGAIHLGEQKTLEVRSLYPGYWKAISYDVYTSQGWTIGPTESHPLGWQPFDGQPVSYKGRQEITEEVEVLHPTERLFIAGVPVATQAAVTVASPAAREYTINLLGSDDEWLPPDLAASARRLRGLLQMAYRARGPAGGLNIVVLGEGGRILTGEPYLTEERRSAILDSTISVTPGAFLVDLQEILPADVKITDVETVDGRLSSLHVKRLEPATQEVLELRAGKPLRAGSRYTVVSSVTVATHAELRAAGTSYPGWVMDHYLQLPDSLPPRVSELARGVTRLATNPYDKALAIEAYLQNLRYDTEIPAPPFGRDGVDYFLFDLGRGYSDYFASAMAVMLRSVGVPSRVALGYAPGEMDAERGVYVVRDRDSHAWVEVYFPDYGWVEFEPTPGRQRILYGQLVEQSQGSAEGVAGGGAGEGPDLEALLEELAAVGVPLTPGPETSRGGWGIGPGLSLSLGLSLLVGVLGWALWRRLFWGGSDPAGTYFAMSRLAGASRLGPEEAQTPGEFAGRLSKTLPDVGAEVTLIAGSFASRRYGRKELSSDERLALAKAWRSVRWRLLMRLLRRR